MFSNITTNFTQPIEIDDFTFRVGVGYICTGAVFIFLQLTCAYLISIDKEMQNPTYKLVINLSIADVVELSSLGFYAGITLLLGYQADIADRVMSFVALTGWYANCLLFVFIGFSRWIAITRSHLLARVFRKNVMTTLHIVSWTPAIWCFYAVVIHEPSAFIFNPQIFSWYFNMETTLGEVWHWTNSSVNEICALVEMTFNILALIYVHQTRKQIRSLAESKNRKRETKLLIQTFILGCVFTAANAINTTAYALGWSSRTACVFCMAAWMSNHCINPVVYLSVNTKLRRSFIRFVTCGTFGNDVGVEPLMSNLSVTNTSRKGPEMATMRAS